LDRVPVDKQTEPQASVVRAAIMLRTVPVERMQRMTKQGTKRERREEGERKKKGKKEKEDSMHSLTKLARPQVRFHKDVDRLISKRLSQATASALMSQPTSKLLKF
jgi:hypothetical protein